MKPFIWQPNMVTSYELDKNGFLIHRDTRGTTPIDYIGHFRSRTVAILTVFLIYFG